MNARIAASFAAPIVAISARKNWPFRWFARVASRHASENTEACVAFRSGGRLMKH
jgi:hypothetical protein